MLEQLATEVVAITRPNLDHLVTEDDTPVDNIFSEKQQRLLTEPLYTSWGGPPGDDPSFVALANVGLFYAIDRPAVVPDTMVSISVQFPEDLQSKEHRSYFLWEYGKPPDVVIEVISNRKGEELGRKQRLYARIGVAYYVVFDPFQQLGTDTLHLFERQRTAYVPMSTAWLPELGLRLTLWEGEYEGMWETWLRWCDQDGALILTGAELARQERERADTAQQQAEAAQQQAEAAQQRIERLLAQLHALGAEPEA
ncbi:MAG: Uma2 family endonuclease [Anaerolinea sp.]|nr:Uma2 family endonuclease [Anaerolinea sp.]